MNKFSALCNGLFRPMCEKASKELFSNTDEIAAKFAARGFPLPPGAMLSEIIDRFEKELEIRAEIIFNSCCQAFKACSQKPNSEDFSKEIIDAITLEHSRITATGENILKQYLTHENTHCHKTIDIYNQKTSSEGRRLLTYYSTKADLFFGESNLEDLVRKNAAVHHWYQRPIGIIGISIIGGVILFLTTYLIGQHFNIRL